MKEKKIDLKSLEKSVFRTLFEDGFYDIFFGVFFLDYAICIYLKHVLSIPFAFLFFPLLTFIDFFIIFYGKRKITSPRIGYVRFREKRRQKLQKMRIIILLSVAVAFVIFLISIINIIPQELLEYELGLIIMDFCFMAIPIGIMGYFLDYPRLYLIGFVGGLCLSITELSLSIFNNYYIGFLMFLISGLIFTFSGIKMLYQFLKKYNIKEKGMLSNER